MMPEIVTYDGEPALIFDLPVNWRSEVSKSFEYKTDIFTSNDGDEQRRATRSTPRKTLVFTVSRADDARRQMAAILSGWHRRLFLVPEIGRSEYTATNLPAAATAVTVGSVPKWLTEGLFVLLSHGRRTGYRQIADVQGHEIHFANVDGQAWPVGTKLTLLQPARILEDTGPKAYTNTVMEASISFSVEPTLDRSQAQRPEYPSLEGMEVFLRRPNWATPIDLTYSTVRNVVDFGYGRTKVEAPEGFTRRAQKVNFLNRNHDEADEFEAFFHRMRGRRGTFLMPTWIDDLEPAQPLVGGNRQMLLPGTLMAQMYADDAVNRKVVVFLKDGRSFLNHILSVGIVSGGYGLSYGMSYGETVSPEDRSTVLDMRYPWPEGVPLNAIRMVSWLTTARLASDSLTFSYQTDGVSQFPCSIMQLKDVALGSRRRYGWGYAYGQLYGGVPA